MVIGNEGITKSQRKELKVDTVDATPQNETNKSKIIGIIAQVIKWGIGGVLMIIGITIMICHKYLDVDFPQYLYIGFGCMAFGCLIYIVETILNFVYKLKKS